MKKTGKIWFSAVGMGVLLAVSTAAPALAAAPAKPAGYLTRPVEVIVPFNPGGGADTSQRIFNKFAEPIVGQRLVVINKPGAGGAVGWAELVRARPDGYTLTVTTPPYNIIPPLVSPKQTGYKMDQFTNIATYAIVPDVLYAKEGGPFKTLQDLVTYAKQNPGKVKAANTGALGADYMTTLMIEHATGTKFTQIPFTGGAAATQATLAGTVDVMVASAIFTKSQQGKLRPLAIATEKRDPRSPQVPTFKELGFDIVSERYRTLSGPPNLPAPIVAYWEQVCKQVVAIPEFQAEMDKTGQPTGYMNAVESKKAIEQMTRDIQLLVDKYDLVTK